MNSPAQPNPDSARTSEDRAREGASARSPQPEARTSDALEALVPSFLHLGLRDEEGDPPQVLGQLLTEIAEALGASCASICLLSAERTHADLILEYGPPPPASHLGSTPPFVEAGEPWPGVRATEGPPPAALAAICLSNRVVRARTDDEAIRSLPPSWGAVESCVGIPVPGADAARGALLLGRRPGEPPFSAEEATLLASVASQVALYSDLLRLTQITAQQALREGSVARVAAACIEADDLTAVFEVAQKTLKSILRADVIQFWVRDETGPALVLQASSAVLDDRLGVRVSLDPDSSSAAFTLAQGRPLQIPNLAAETRFETEPALSAAGLRSAATTPMLANGESFGVVCVYFRSHVGIMDDDARFLQSIADLVAGALARRQAEEERAQNEAMFREAVTGSPVPLLVYDASGRLFGSSRRVWELTGHEPDPVTRLDDWYMLAYPDPEYRARVMRRIQQVQRHAEDIRTVGDFEVTCADGSTRLWTVILNPILRAGKSPLFFMAGLDVTEERRAQDHLRQAQKMEAVGRLAGGIAHDFNNLLTVISGYTDIALNRLDTGHRAAVALQEVALASDRAGRMTDRLLAFSRQQKLNPQPLDLNDLVQSLMGFVQRLIGERVTCELQLDPSLPLVHADHGGLEQTVLNLILNARDAMEQVGTVVVGTQSVPEGTVPPHVGRPAVTTDQVLLWVSDEGCGMPPQVLHRIFEPFFTTKAPGAGTGLGLASSYATVKQSGGDIRVVSHEGRGTTFGVLLPLAHETLPTAMAVQPQAPAGGTETVLIAEDGRQVRDLARATLETLGYRVLAAPDGVEALKVADAHDGPIHLLVTDVVMPNMGGTELARRFARKRPEAHVLFISGYAGLEPATGKAEAPPGATLRKPFTSTALAHHVRDVLDTDSAPSDD